MRTRAMGEKLTDVSIPIRHITNGDHALPGLIGILSCIKQTAICRKHAMATEVPVVSRLKLCWRPIGVGSKCHGEASRTTREHNPLASERMGDSVMPTPGKEMPGKWQAFSVQEDGVKIGLSIATCRNKGRFFSRGMRSSQSKHPVTEGSAQERPAINWHRNH